MKKGKRTSYQLVRLLDGWKRALRQVLRAKISVPIENQQQTVISLIYLGISYGQVTTHIFMMV
jgi:hypothetical protein